MEIAKVKPTSKDFFAKESVKKKFEELMGARSAQFITSVLQVVSGNTALQLADPQTVYTAACIAAILNLPINNNLGFAYIVPYKGQAQFQLGYKGFIQLAQRTGLYQTIAACPVYDGQLISENPLTGFVFDFTKKTSETIIGYAAYFKLLNGFEKTEYWTKDKVEKHATRFSQSFKQKSGVWATDFDSMAMKTVLKNLLSKYGPLSIEMQKAIQTDQAVIKDEIGEEVEYTDAAVVDEAEELHANLAERFNMIEHAMSADDKADSDRILTAHEANSYAKLDTLLSRYEDLAKATKE